MPLSFDLRKDDLKEKLLKSPNKNQCSCITYTLTNCNTNWFNISWLGFITYTFSMCINYLIGYYSYRALNFGWGQPKLTRVRIFGDLVTTGWFAVGIAALPWHQWERFTCLQSKNRCKGFARYLVWMFGTIFTLLVYGWMREQPLFQTSLNTKDMTFNQRMVYVVTFTVVGGIVAYWIAKLFVLTDKSKSTSFTTKCCVPSMQKKIIFIRLTLLLTMIFVLSYFICISEECDYHLHHWWLGFVLILLTTASLDNFFDYFLQGVFWAFLLESIFNYTIIFGHFFI
jgi:hypothetical protein